MAINPLSPGVYIEEIPLLPGSIAGVATAIPAFIGYVEKAERNGVGIPYNTPVRITSLLEYETIFGKAQGQSFTVDIDDNTLVTPTVRTITVNKSLSESKYKLYYNMVMYFSNGGGPCYVVPVGLYTTQANPDKADILDGLGAISKVDEPTLLLFPDAVSLAIAHSREIYDSALAQCELLKDRFVIMDLPNTGNPNADAVNFRTNGIGPDSLKYGASYYPNLSTTLNFGINPNLIHINSQEVNGNPVPDSADVIDFLNKLEITIYDIEQGYYNAKIATVTPVTDFVSWYQGKISTTSAAASTAYGVGNVASVLPAVSAPLAAQITNIASGNFFTANDDYINAAPITTVEINALLSEYKALLNAFHSIRSLAYTDLSSSTTLVLGSLANFNASNPSIYSSIISQINTHFITLNPCGSMAGIYARVDRERGVWKAPANVGVRSIVGPSINVTTSQQDELNIDATSGKSINVIRAFTGRGTLVWGGRTLAGNDNEWRYVNVRRLFIYVEESIQEATEFVVFESNTATTWTRVKGMIDSFLTGLWRDGALAGATTEEAFFVRVGIGTTMTPQDVLEGRMIVEIGLAAVRPAEFIILKFMHKLQES